VRAGPSGGATQKNNLRGQIIFHITGVMCCVAEGGLGPNASGETTPRCALRRSIITDSVREQPRFRAKLVFFFFKKKILDL
jgi:hypothetical protein